MVMVLRLYYRPDWVAQERRQAKCWIPEGATDWRSVENELPKDGEPVIIMAKGKHEVPYVARHQSKKQ
jgi:mannitol operon repressor